MKRISYSNMLQIKHVFYKAGRYPFCRHKQAGVKPEG